MTSTSESEAATNAPAAPRWGLPAPDGVAASWGARAIFLPLSTGGPFIDVPRDWQSFTGAEAECRALDAWLITRGLAALQTRAHTEALRGDERREVLAELEGYVIIANPNASYGYLYIAAWRVPVAPREPETIQTKAKR